MQIEHSLHSRPVIGIYFPGIPSLGISEKRQALLQTDTALLAQPLGSDLLQKAVDILNKRLQRNITASTLLDPERINLLSSDTIDPYEHIRHLMRNITSFHLLKHELKQQDINLDVCTRLFCGKSMGILSAMLAAKCISYENAVWIAATMAEIHMDSYRSNPKKYVSQKLYKVSHEQLDHLQACWKQKSQLPVYILEHDPQVQTLLQYAEEDQEMIQETYSQFNITGSRIAYFPSAAHTPRTQEKALKLQALFLSDNPFIAPKQGILIHTQSLRQPSAFLHTTSMLKQELFDISTGRIDLSRLCICLERFHVLNKISL